jgi:ATP-dependent DNA ligase
MKYLFPCVPNRIDAKAPYFKSLNDDPKWIGEVKKRGWRCGAYQFDERLELWTRNATLIKDPLSELREELRGLIPFNTIIDGELIEKATKTVKGIYYVFDILIHEGTPVYQRAWTERRKIIEKIFASTSDRILLSVPVRMGKVKLYYDSIEGEENEGIVLKKTSAPYIIGTKDCPVNPFWVKVKRPENYMYAEKGRDKA